MIRTDPFAITLWIIIVFSLGTVIFRLSKRKKTEKTSQETENAALSTHEKNTGKPVKIYRGNDLQEIALLKSLLESENIPYFLTNENMSSLYPGLMIKNYAEQTISVPEHMEYNAHKLIKDYFRQ